jgi:hypothetical protein
MSFASTAGGKSSKIVLSNNNFVSRWIVPTKLRGWGENIFPIRMVDDGNILIILNDFKRCNFTFYTIFKALKLPLWENFNYLINRAKSCYENSDNDDKMGGRHHTKVV